MTELFKDLCFPVGDLGRLLVLVKISQPRLNCCIYTLFAFFLYNSSPFVYNIIM